ncbi:MAG: response regulator transcription factor [Chloroflexi bacterium]|nr:response regulator transcription factor [Chloroflexota bacterium]
MPEIAPSEVRVFVLDDEPEYAQPNIDALERKRYDVVQAQSVDEAVEILEKQGTSFKVLILDMLMPDSTSRQDRNEYSNPIESGLKLHKQIRGKLGLVDVPIIFTSVVRDPKIRERIREEEGRYTRRANSVSFLTKPFLPMDLIERVKKVTAQ